MDLHAECPAVCAFDHRLRVGEIPFRLGGVSDDVHVLFLVRAFKHQHRPIFERRHSDRHVVAIPRERQFHRHAAVLVRRGSPHLCDVA